MGEYDKMLSKGEKETEIEARRRKHTLTSNSLYASISPDDPIKITGEAKNIAIMIFDQYLKRGAINYIPLPKDSREAIYEKFGISGDLQASVDSTRSDYTVRDA